MPPIDPQYTSKKPKRRKVTVTTPDRADDRAAIRKDQLARSRSVSPDRQDTKRSPAQQRRDRTVVAENIRASTPVRLLPKYEKAREASRKQRAARLAPALTVLEQTARPSHAVAAGARAAIHGKNPIPAAGRGFALKDKSLFSDVLRDLGVKGPIASVGGFALDVAADPTTYLSFGVGSVGRKAAEKAGRKATEKALKAGASKKAADKAGRAAAGKAAGRESNAGLKVGFAGKTTSGRTTAKLSRAVRAPRAGEKLRAALPGRLVRHVAPSVRPAGVSEQDFLKVRSAMVRGRAIASVGEKRVRNRAQAVARALPGDAHPKITDALESRSLAGLTPEEAQVARALAHDYDAMHQAEHSRGLVGPKFKEFGYSPRRAVSELEPAGSRKRLGGAQLESSKARTNRRPRAQFRGTKDDIYTENAALGYYLRGRDSYVKQGRKEVIDSLHDVGRRWHVGQALKDGEEIYKFTGRKMPSRVEGDELKSLMRGGAPPGLSEYRVLHRDLVKTAEQGIPERLEGLEELGRIWDRQIQGRVKTVLTVVNPQYHATNLYGDLFNAYKAAPVAALARDLGVSVRALTYRARREAASKTLAKQVAPSGGSVKIGGHRVTLDVLIKEAEDHGAINQGFIGRDLAEVLDRQGKEAAQRLGQGKVARRTRAGQAIATSRVGSKVAHPIDTIRDIGQYREDAVRLALYLGRRRKGDTADEAARFTNRHLFDYGDLTQFEKSVLRRVLPFYTFTARNFPQQVRALLERPGKYANLEKVREEAQRTSDVPEGYERFLRRFEQQGLPIPVPGQKNLLYLKLPAMDLGRLSVSDQGNYLMAMLTPVLKAPVEYTQNYNFFFREKIDQLIDQKGPDGETVRQIKPAPRWLVEGLRKLPHGKDAAEALHIRQFTDKKTGKRIWGWPAKLDYLLKQTPASGTALQFGTGTTTSRGQTTAQKVLGYGTGLKSVPFSKPDVDKQRAGSRYDFLQAKAKAMRHDGDAYNPNGTRTGAYQKVLDESREVFKLIDTSPKASSGVDPAETEKLLRGLGAGGGTTIDQDEVDKLLRGIGAR